MLGREVFLFYSETAYLKGNIGANDAMEYLWTENYDNSRGTNAINLCGVILT